MIEFLERNKLRWMAALAAQLKHMVMFLEPDPDLCPHTKVKVLLVDCTTLEPTDGYCNICNYRVKRHWVKNET